MHSALALWFLGDAQGALERSRRGLARARELAHTGSIANALPFIGMVHQLRGDVDAVREVADSLIALSKEHGFQQWLACGQVLEGWVNAERGGRETSVAMVRGGLGDYRATGNELYAPYFVWILASTQLRCGDIADGLETVAAALAAADATGTRLWVADLHRLEGELLLARDPGTVADAETAFRQALDIARRQGAKAWELRAAASHARLLHRQGKRDEARRTLADVYGGFTEGFDTADLRAARTLLDDLSAASR